MNNNENHRPFNGNVDGSPQSRSPMKAFYRMAKTLAAGMIVASLAAVLTVTWRNGSLPKLLRKAASGESVVPAKEGALSL
jgi:hypothetical protein